MTNFKENKMRKFYDQVMPKLMKKYGFNERTDIFKIMNDMITDPEDLKSFKLAFKYPNGRANQSNEISTTFQGGK